MKQARLHFSMLVLALAIAAFALGRAPDRASRSDGEAPGAFDVLKVLPRDASLSLTIDFDENGAQPLRDLLLRRGRELPDVGQLKDVCGYDPTSEIHQLGLALFAPDGKSDDPAIAIATHGVFDAKRVADCAKKLVVRRGGTPSTEQQRNFRVIGGGPRSMARIAVRNDGLVLLGEQKYLDEMLASAEGERPSLAEHPGHARLRRKVGADAPVLLSVVLPQGWLERLFPGEATGSSALARVRGAALGLSVKSDAELRGRIECTSSDACAQLAALCRKLWTKLEPALVQLAGPGATDHAELSEGGAALSLSWQLAPQTLEELLFDWPVLERAASSLEPALPPRPPAPASSKPFVPDRVINVTPPPTSSVNSQP